MSGILTSLRSRESMRSLPAKLKANLQRLSKEQRELIDPAKIDSEILQELMV